MPKNPKPVCDHPEHWRPYPIPSPGVYEHVCPKCKVKRTVIIGEVPQLGFRG